MRKDRIYLSVKNTVSDLKLLDDYDNEEAMEICRSKRKFLFDRILKEYDPRNYLNPKMMTTRKTNNNNKQFQK